VSDKLLQLIPAEGVKIFLTLFLAFLIGLEREEHRAAGQRYSFGGVRTFPLIGLIGYGLALLSGSQLLPLTAGFAVIGAFLWLSYRHKLEASNEAGITTEMSGLTTYVVGALVARDQLWIATTLAVLSMLLLELKEFLESLTKKIPGEEILTFTKFLLLTFVILPVVPNQEFGPFALNPLRAWLVVVAVSGVSYGSYLLEKMSKGEGGVPLVGLLGGAYSSTFTTLVMARQARSAHAPHRYTGGIVIASGVMYVRFLILIGFFNRELAGQLLVPFLLLGALGVVAGWLWSRTPDGAGDETSVGYVTKNPLELTAAFSFAVTFVVMLAATNFALRYLGRGGIFGLAALSGIAPVDPFIMGLSQTAGKLTPMELTVAGVIVAAASNNVAKAVLAICLADRKTGRQSFVLLLSLAALGLLPLVWILR
jgi:uncharacterized membrane protein (DUF4010 family)